MASKNNNDQRKVSEEFVIQVFDKVREVNQELAEDVKGLRNAVIGFGDAFNKRYEGQPRPGELHTLLNNWGDKFEIRHAASKEKLLHLEKILTTSATMLKEHCDHADAGFCSIEEELKEDEGMLKKIFDGVSKLTNRVTIMIAVVAVAFSIVTVAYLFVRSSVDTIVEKKAGVIEQQYQDEFDKKMNRLERLIRDHMKDIEKEKKILERGS